MTEIKFDTYWTAGDDAPERAAALVVAALEALHTLNYATMRDGGAMTEPAHAYDLVGKLAQAIGYLPQACRQIANWLSGAEGLQHGSGRSISETVEAVRAALFTAQRQADNLMHSLQYAQNDLSALYQDAPAVDVDPPSVTQTPAFRQLFPETAALANLDDYPPAAATVRHALSADAQPLCGAPMGAVTHMTPDVTLVNCPVCLERGRYARQLLAVDQRGPLPALREAHARELAGEVARLNLQPIPPLTTDNRCTCTYGMEGEDFARFPDDECPVDHAGRL